MKTKLQTKCCPYLKSYRTLTVEKPQVRTFGGASSEIGGAIPPTCILIKIMAHKAFHIFHFNSM